VFCLYGLLGLVWSIGFWLQCRDRPQQHPGCNAAERQLIEGTFTAPADSQSVGDNRPPPRGLGAGGVLREFGEILLQIVISPTMWLMCVISVLVNVGWIFLVTFLPTYFREVHNVPLSTIGFLAAIPTIASMMGGLSGGVAADRFVRRYGLVWGRRMTGAIASGAAAAVYCIALAADHWLLLIALFAAIGFLIDFGLGALWAVYQDIAGPRVAAVLGFANMCGNLSAAYFSSAIGGFAKSGQWRTIFLIAAASLACNLVLWMFVSPNRKMTFNDCATGEGTPEPVPRRHG
jgi:sugar phosphate permease